MRVDCDVSAPSTDVDSRPGSRAIVDQTTRLRMHAGFDYGRSIRDAAWQDPRTWVAALDRDDCHLGRNWLRKASGPKLSALRGEVSGSAICICWQRPGEGFYRAESLGLVDGGCAAECRDNSPATS